MSIKAFSPVLDIKSLDEDGTISGYGAIFNNKDMGGDILIPAAFAGSLAEHRRVGTTVKMFWQHDPREPIGRWTDLSEDGKGLYVEGRLNMDVQRAREAYALLKNGDIDGLSIGYATIESEPDHKRGATLLKKVKLFEVSVVSIAMNERARVESVKASDRLAEFSARLRDGEPPQIKEFEDILRDAGVPKSMAVRIASVGYAKAIRGEPEGEKASELAEFLRMVRGG